MEEKIMTKAQMNKILKRAMRDLVRYGMVRQEQIIVKTINGKTYKKRLYPQFRNEHELNVVLEESKKFCKEGNPERIYTITIVSYYLVEGKPDIEVLEVGFWSGKGQKFFWQDYERTATGHIKFGRKEWKSYKEKEMAEFLGNLL